MNNLITLIGSAISGVWYYLGGTGGVWWKSSWVRDWLCSLTVLAVLSLTGMWHWSLLMCFPLMIMALSTYHKWLNKYFGKPTSDCFWFNWLAHGLGIGLALIPYGIYTDTTPIIICRALLMGGLMALWSSILIPFFKLNRKWNDGGRGAIIICTLRIL